MPAFLKAFWILVQYLPQVISAIQAGEDWIDLKIGLKKFDEAADAAVLTKDTSQLEGLFNPKPDPAPKPGAPKQ